MLVLQIYNDYTMHPHYKETRNIYKSPYVGVRCKRKSQYPRAQSLQVPAFPSALGPGALARAPRPGRLGPGPCVRGPRSERNLRQLVACQKNHDLLKQNQHGFPKFFQTSIFPTWILELFVSNMGFKS